MRILCLNPYLPPPLGGIEKEMLAVAGELRDLGHQVSVLTSDAQFPRGRNLTPDVGPRGIEMRTVRGYLRSDLRGFAPARAPLLIPGLAHTAMEFAPDLTLVFNIGWGPALRPVLRTLAPRAPILYRTFFHPPGGRLARFKTPYLLNTVAMADRAFVSTQRELSQLVATRLLDPGRLAVIPPGVSLHESDPARVARLAAQHQLTGKRVIAHVGRLCAFKGTYHLIEVLAEVRQRAGVEAILLLIGADQGEQNLPALAARHGVAAHVRVAGELRDDAELRALLASCHVMALPSEYEAYGIAYIEALAEGVPVIGCDVGGVREAIAGAGRLLPAFGDRAALANALVELLTDEAARVALGSAGRARVLGTLTWRHTAERILELGRQATAGRTGAVR